jgi:hypothetical protein
MRYKVTQGVTLDSRCIRKLKTSPKEFCPSAVHRLRWREQLGREPTEEEELSAPGCPWAVRSHEHNFCFFKAYDQDREKLTDSQIAHMLGVSESTVKKTAIRAEKKVANYQPLKELKELYGDESIIDDRLVDPYEDHLNDLSGISISSVADEVPIKSDDDV